MELRESQHIELDFKGFLGFFILSTAILCILGVMLSFGCNLYQDRQLKTYEKVIQNKYIVKNLDFAIKNNIDCVVSRNVNVCDQIDRQLQYYDYNISLDYVFETYFKKRKLSKSIN